MQQDEERKKVYYTQIPETRNAEGKKAPLFSVQDSLRFGDPIVLFEHYVSVNNTPDLFSKIRKGLADFKRGEFLVIAGDPAIYAYACAYLGREVGHFYLLRWDKYHKYYKTPITTF